MPVTSDSRHFDVIIIGGGPSGLAASVRLKQLGVSRVLVVERQPQLGGIPVHTAHFGFAIRHLKRLLTGPQYARKLAKAAYDAGVTIATSTTVFKLDPLAKEMTCVSERGHTTYRAEAILMATGCRETTRSALLLPGFRGRGIMSTSEAQQYIHLMHTLPGKRIVVFGSEDVGLSAVHTFGLTRAKVVGMVEEGPRMIGRKVFALGTLVPHRVPLYTRHTIKQILGSRRVEGVEIAAVDGQGNLLPGTERTIACDTLIVSGKFLPENALARSADIPLDSYTHGPVVDQQLQSDIPGIFASGNLLRGVETADVAALEGEWAAAAISRYLKDAATFMGPRLKLTPEAPVKWVLPQRLLPDMPLPPPYLSTLRVSEQVSRSRIIVGPEGKIWRSRKYLKLMPERRIRLNLHKWNMGANEDTIEISLAR